MSAAKMDTARDLALRRELYAPRKRDEVQITREAHDAARALATATESWVTFLPRRAQLEAAQHAVIGLGRLLGELGALQGGGNDAAA